MMWFFLNTIKIKVTKSFINVIQKINLYLFSQMCKYLILIQSKKEVNAYLIAKIASVDKENDKCVKKDLTLNLLLNNGYEHPI